MAGIFPPFLRKLLEEKEGSGEAQREQRIGKKLRENTKLIRFISKKVSSTSDIPETCHDLEDSRFLTLAGKIDKCTYFVAYTVVELHHSRKTLLHLFVTAHLVTGGVTYLFLLRSPGFGDLKLPSCPPSPTFTPPLPPSLPRRSLFLSFHWKTCFTSMKCHLHLPTLLSFPVHPLSAPPPPPHSPLRVSYLACVRAWLPTGRGTSSTYLHTVRALVAWSALVVSHGGLDTV